MALLAELELQSLGSRLYAASLANVLAVHLLRHYTTADFAGQRLTGGLSGHRSHEVISTTSR
jgi:AraC family transcriptional regulator